VARTFDEIAAQNPQGAVAVVAHGGTLRAGLAYLFPDTMTDRWAYDLPCASLSHARMGREGNSLLALGDCQHLGETHEAGMRTGCAIGPDRHSRFSAESQHRPGSHER
jgi:broad specificity phosphatase PhoE